MDTEMATQRLPRTMALPVLAGVAVATLVFSAGVVWADHSLGAPCLSCHALRASAVVPGSRNVNCEYVSDPLYGWTLTCGTTASDWYCGGPWDPGAQEPLDCSYCHGTPGDIANEISLSQGGANGSAHPVRVGADTVSPTYPSAIRITCNDCHDGDTDSGTNPGPDLTPEALCTKSVDDGYPNHHNLTLGAADPGTNNLTDNPPHLTGKYGPLGGPVSSDGGVDWEVATLAAADLLCFVCHDGASGSGTNPPYSSISEDTDTPPTNDGSKASNIAYYYNMPGGGHNVPYDGAGTLGDTGGGIQYYKLPCYDCHDPHAAAGTGINNEGLVLNGNDDPANPYQTSDFSVTGYTGTNDRDVCYGCHAGGYTVEGVTPPDITPGNAVFTYHALAPSIGADVHNDARTSGNCLQPNGGCHQGAHNTDFFRCLDCHSTHDPRCDPITGTPIVNNHIDSEFGHIARVGLECVNTGDANYIQSAHSIPYDDTQDMSDPANNGCLHCHNTRTTGHAPTGMTACPDGTILQDPEDVCYARTDPGNDPENLEAYNGFCLSCHDGSGSTFAWSVDYFLNDGGNGEIQYPSGTLYPPQVNNPGVGAWNKDSLYYFNSGHGRGTSGTSTTPYSPSGNSYAAVPCLECHVYHGSTAFKLLPGWREANDGVGHVVKGAGYSPETIDTQLGIGMDGTRDSTNIDYRDYTDAANNSRIPTTPNYFLSRYYSDYQNNSPIWATYLDGTNITANDLPDGTYTPFGTSGDMHPNTKSTDEVTPGQSVTTGKVGFCNACHFYKDVTQVWGTNETAGFAYTHEGQVGLVDSDGNDLESQNDFFKDCVECHDPHGSGRGTSDDGEDNIYMIRKKIKHGLTQETDTISTTNWSAVVFRNLTGPESYDESDVDNTNELCAVCHQSSAENATNNVDHNYRSWTGSPPSGSHQEGSNCAGGALPGLSCHPHGKQ